MLRRAASPCVGPPSATFTLRPDRLITRSSGLTLPSGISLSMLFRSVRDLDLRSSTNGLFKGRFLAGSRSGPGLKNYHREDPWSLLATPGRVALPGGGPSWRHLLPHPRSSPRMEITTRKEVGLAFEDSIPGDGDDAFTESRKTNGVRSGRLDPIRGPDALQSEAAWSRRLQV